MEMNTRLQVEHPVTEMITGIDLVEWQIRVAAGEKLPKLQPEIAICGHAVEARLYAEDPSRGFLPATGRIFHAAFPEKLRVDAGIEAGDAVEPWYDPMIAKVIAQGPDRATALAMLAEGLDATEIVGCVTNVSFLSRLVRHPGFNAGTFDTGLIARDLPSLVAPEPLPSIAEAAAALCVLGLYRLRSGADPFDRIGSWALWEAPVHHGELTHNGEVRSFRANTAAGSFWRVAFDDGEAEIALSALSHNRFLLSAADGAEPVSIVRWPGHVTVFLRGIGHVFGVADPFAAAIEAASGDTVSAPMPGIVRVLHVAAGQAVKRGEPLLVLEAMKMEHVLGAPRDCVIAAIAVSQGEQVADGRLLVTFVAEEG
jgi:3-methylcrotonyl-CoA carboxylase alpha subunit